MLRLLSPDPPMSWAGPGLSRRRTGASRIARMPVVHANVLATKEIVRRVQPTPGSQLHLDGVLYTYHAFITDREGPTLELEADHRRHAVVENAIRDLKYGVGLNHMPSGRFGANAAWLALNVSPATWRAG